MMAIIWRGEGPKKQREAELKAFAESIGLKASRPTKHEGPTLRGRIDGHKIRIRTASIGFCRFRLDYESGLQSFSICDRSADIRTNRVEISTEDARFDAQYRTLVGELNDVGDLLSFLTPQRRQAILALGQTLEIHKIKNDEFEVRLHEDAPIEAIRQGIDLSVQVAKTLDVSAPPQDATRAA